MLPGSFDVTPKRIDVCIESHEIICLPKSVKYFQINPVEVVEEAVCLYRLCSRHHLRSVWRLHRASYAKRWNNRLNFTD